MKKNATITDHGEIMTPLNNYERIVTGIKQREIKQILCTAKPC